MSRSTASVVGVGCSGLCRRFGDPECVVESSNFFRDTPRFVANPREDRAGALPVSGTGGAQPRVGVERDEVEGKDRDEDERRQRTPGDRMTPVRKELSRPPPRMGV
jgi:hypothetical protein